MLVARGLRPEHSLGGHWLLVTAVAVASQVIRAGGFFRKRSFFGLQAGWACFLCFSPLFFCHPGSAWLDFSGLSARAVVEAALAGPFGRDRRQAQGRGGRAWKSGQLSRSHPVRKFSFAFALHWGRPCSR